MSGASPLTRYFCSFCGRRGSDVKQLITSPARTPGEPAGRLAPEQVAIRAKVAICDSCVHALLPPLQGKGVAAPPSRGSGAEACCHFCAASQRDVPLHIGAMATICRDCLEACGQCSSVFRKHP